MIRIEAALKEIGGLKLRQSLPEADAKFALVKNIALRLDPRALFTQYLFKVARAYATSIDPNQPANFNSA